MCMITWHCRVHLTVESILTANISKNCCGNWAFGRNARNIQTELSGGQQQRSVAIARALANKPSILLCDEPTGNLDSATTIEVMGLLKTSCRKYNQTILMVTHNEAIAQTCDRVIHIEDGQIVTGKRRFPAKGGDVVC